MNFEKINNEKEPKIVIKKSSEAPDEFINNPFYDEEYWGRAYSPDDIYIPDSDEALSFSLGAHEIGHLLKEGKRKDTGLDNFEAVFAEEERAWKEGWKYLSKYLSEYFEGRPDDKKKIIETMRAIKKIHMDVVLLSKEMYLEKGKLDSMEEEETKKVIEDRSEFLLKEKGEEIKKAFDSIKQQKIGIKLDWDKFTEIVKKAVEDIVEENKKFENQN